MSALLESLLDNGRRADCEANDRALALTGFTEAQLIAADHEHNQLKTTGELQRQRYERALDQQVQQQNLRGAWA